MAMCMHEIVCSTHRAISESSISGWPESSTIPLAGPGAEERPEARPDAHDRCHSGFLLRDGMGDARDSRQIRSFSCVAVSLNATASFVGI
jgi:hypothetical protein